MSLLIKHFYRFGSFTLDTDQRVLFREDKPAALTPKVFDTLLILVENKGRIVEKEELMNRLWPDTFVEETNLTFNIKQLRKLLGDDARQPVYIETIAKRGYRFIAGVEEVLTDDGVGQITQRYDPSDSEAAIEPKRLEPEAQATLGQPSIEFAGAQDRAGAVLEPAPLPVGVADTNGRIGRRTVLFASSLILLTAAVALVYFFVHRSSTGTRDNRNFQRVKFRGLTVVGSASAAAISPDGKFISYVVNDNGKYSLWTKAVAAGSAVEIVPPSEIGIFTTTFSPDGDYVYYLVRYKDFRTVLHRISVLGGRSTEVKPDVGNDVSSFSPDGRQFTYVRLSPDLSESQLCVAAIEGDENRVIATRPSANPLVDGPSWSPDGKNIAVGSSGAIHLVSVSTGEVTPLTEERWDSLGRVVWFKDGSG